MELALIQQKIHELRGHKIMFDYDSAALYEVETRVLNQAVKRNLNRFPPDFMFQLTREEYKILISQIVISKSETRGGTQKLPFAFTEQGVAMLSAVLHSDKAIDVNIAIMRTFVLIRQYALTYKELSERLRAVEGQFTDVYEAINYLLNKDKQQITQAERTPIGYAIAGTEK